MHYIILDNDCLLYGDKQGKFELMGDNETGIGVNCDCFRLMIHTNDSFQNVYAY